MLFLFTFYRKFCKNTVARQQGKRTEFLSPCFWLTSLQVEEAAFANGSGLSYFLQLFTMYLIFLFHLCNEEKEPIKKMIGENSVQVFEVTLVIHSRATEFLFA